MHVLGNHGHLSAETEPGGLAGAMAPPTLQKLFKIGYSLSFLMNF